MYHLFIVMLFVFICSGCGTVYTSELRANPGFQAQFDVDAGLQTVIKNISGKRDECKTFGFEHIAILDDLGEARVEYRHTDHTILAFVELKSENNKTSVSIYASQWVAKRSFDALEQGAKGLPGCP